MLTVELYTHHLTTSSREQLKRDATRTGKEIKRCGTIEIDIPVHHIEDILFCKIGGWPCLESARYLETTAFIFSCYYSHGEQIYGLNDSIYFFTNNVIISSGKPFMRVIGARLNSAEGLIVATLSTNRDNC